MRIEAEAFVAITQMIAAGHKLELYRFGNGYEITILWKDRTHSHFNGDTLIECVKKASKEYEIRKETL